MNRTKRIATLSPVAIGGAAATLILTAAAALACHSTVTGTTSCNQGEEQVIWTVTNVSAKTGATEHASYTSTEGLSGQTQIQPLASVQIIENLPGNTAGSDTLTVTGKWHLTVKRGPVTHTSTDSGTVQLAGDCQTPPPPQDACSNLPGVQKRVPAGYLGVDGKCYKVSPPPQRHHHKKPAAQPPVSQPSAVVHQPAPITISTKEQASLGGGG